jgi:biotin carboxyl carrier protein
LPTRLNISVAPKAAEPREHQLEFEAAINGEQGGEVRCVVDGEEAGRANWARIGPGLYSILLDGRSYDVRVNHPVGASQAPDYDVRVGGEAFRVAVRDPRSRQQADGAAGASGPQEITAPMPGKVVKLLVQEGDQVEADQGLLVIEAMKMQNELRAPRPGRVERIYLSEGTGVETGAPLVRLA